MREQVIDLEKRYVMTHGLAIKEGEEFAREEYGAKIEEGPDLKDLRCQKVERYGILEKTDR